MYMNSCIKNAIKIGCVFKNTKTTHKQRYLSKQKMSKGSEVFLLFNIWTKREESGYTRQV